MNKTSWLVIGLLLYSIMFVGWHLLDVGEITMCSCRIAQIPDESCMLENGIWQANASLAYHAGMYGMIVSGALLGLMFFVLLFRAGK